jgi:predicted TIM-barrel enzyme
VFTEVTEDLAARFREASAAQGVAMDKGMADAANDAHDAQALVLQRMRALPDNGRSVLVGLLQDADPYVRSHAATALLPIDEAPALAVLEEVAKLRRMPIVSFNAEMVLQEWRAGRLRRPFGVELK